MRTQATRLAGLVGAAALLGGLALSAGVAVYAQTGSTPTPVSNVGGPNSVPSARFYGTVTSASG
ncbi:MAG TPA: Fe3+-hydroxamate ABC transporter substrate-binding protein, partial [Dehalococcoidia bacterium]|nr:Fe3+-hydroxamate ABC transporter substrate-binding protein [Dehalococcoidia bacterium]